MTDPARQAIRFWDFPRHFAALEDEVVPEMLATLRAGDLVMRRQLLEFEDAFASFIGTEHAVGVSNCTDGLRLTLEALDVGPGDEVITVAHTFVATLAAIRQVGATPVLVDVGGDHLMNPALLEAVRTERTKGIIPVHLNGRTCLMDRIMAFAQEHGLFVLEDAAQAAGASFDGKAAGTFGVASCYSFYPAKLLGAFGDGGAVLTDDANLAARLRLLRDHGRATKDNLGGWGWNCRLDNLQAAILSVKLPHLKGWIDRRRQIATCYHLGLANVGGLDLPPAPDEGQWFDVFQNYVVETNRRSELKSFLGDRGIETMVSWPIPVHRQGPLGLSHYALPNTEALSDRVLSLPIYPELTQPEVDRVIETVREFFGA